MSGRLFIIATPIGNLADLTLRAKRALEDSELVFAEDTRVTLKLLNHLGLKKQLLSCHEFNEAKRLSVVEDLAAKDATAALVSDAGSPLVSDPGYHIVRKAIAAGMQVVPIPGPSAFLLALVGSGLRCDRFTFEGFLPDRAADRERRLSELKHDQRTMIFYMAPHDLQRLLQELLEAFGERPACLARELTKIHEEFLRGTLSELLAISSSRTMRGECVLVVAGAPARAEEAADAKTVMEALVAELNAGRRLKEAAKEVARRYHWPASEVYKLGIEQRTE